MGVRLWNDTYSWDCSDPAAVYEVARTHSWPIEQWVSKPNSFTCLLGFEPGIGYVILDGQSQSQLDTSLLWKIDFENQAIGEGTKTVTLKGLLVKRTTCITPGLENDYDAAHLVELVDRRALLVNRPINSAYNVRRDPGISYYPGTLNGGVAWTWTAMVENIWTAIGTNPATAASPQLGTYPGLPFTPDGTPENFSFYGTTGFKALEEVLRKLSCTLKFDPLTDAFSIIALAGGTAPGSDAIWNYYPTEGDRVRLPGMYRVHFHRQSGGSEYPLAGTTTYYTVDVAGTGSDTATYLLLYDDLPAVYNSTGTLTNTAALAARAAEVVTKFQTKVTDFDSVADKICPGPQSLAPGTVLGISWYDRGTGYKTESFRKPILIDTRPPPEKFVDCILAKITSGTNPYAWTEQSYTTTGGFTDATDGRTGTVSDFPAYERNDSALVQADTHVLLWRSFLNDGGIRQEWVFDHCCDGGGQLTITSVTLGTSQNNYAAPTRNILYVTATANISITGFSGGAAGRCFEMVNAGASTGTITIPHESGSSSAANQVSTPTAGDWQIPPRSSARFKYLGTKWLIADIPIIPGQHVSWGVRKITGNDTLLRSDARKMIEYEGGVVAGHTLTLFDIDSTTFPADSYFAFYVRNLGTGTLFIAPAGAELINNSNTAISIHPCQGEWIFCDGTEWYTGPGRTCSGLTEISASPYTLSAADNGKLLCWTGAGTLVMNEPTGGLPKGVRLGVRNVGSTQASLIEYTRNPSLVKDDIPRNWGYDLYVPDTMDAGSTAYAMMGMTFFGVRKITANDSLLRSDNNRMIEYEGSGHTLTLFDIDSTLHPGDSYFAFCVRNLGTGTLTVTPSGVETINNTTTLRIDPCQGTWIFCDGAEWYTLPGIACPQSGSGTPSHTAPEGTRYWDTTNNINYYNHDGGTGWTAVSGSSYDYLGRLVYVRIAIAGVTTITANHRVQHTLGGTTYTVTLPAAAAFDTEHYAFYALPTLSGIVTLAGNGTEEIQGPRGSGAVVNRTRQYVKNEHAFIEGDGTNWRVLAETMLEVGFSAYLNSAQTITSGAAVKVVCDTEDWDINANFATGTHTPTAPGIYRYSAAIKLVGDVLGVAGANSLHFYKNGALYKTVSGFLSAAIDDVTLNGTIEMSMNGTTDYCDLYFQHAHTVSLLTGTQTSTHFSGTRIRRDVS